MNGPTQRNRSAADPVVSLPTDKTLPRRSELDTADQLFSQEPAVTSKLVEQGKEVAVILIVVFVISLPQIDTLLNRFVPICNTSPYIGILIKSLAAAIIIWLVRYFYLSRASRK